MSQASPAADAPFRPGPVRVLLSAAFWAYLMLSSALFFVVALLIFLATLAFDRRRVVLHRFTCFWAFHYVQLCPFWSVKIFGRERVPKGAALLCPNHQSLGDILILFGLRRHFKWVSKAAVFKVPFIGWNMRLNDYVGLRRGDEQSIAAMMEHCHRHLAAGSAIMIFPEGTRSRDGEIKSFKHGAFTLATENESPIVPIVVDGTMEALPKSGWVFTNGARLQVRVEVLEPIDAAGRDPHELREQVRTQMVEALARRRAA